MPKGRGLIRSLNRKGTKSDRSPAVTHLASAPTDPTVCERCGAVYARKAWRRHGRVTQTLLAQAAWAVCPACRQLASGTYYGRVLLRGGFAADNEPAIRQRIANVVDRAQHTQPERRLVSFEQGDTGLEVLTTSQKLAHRIVRELKKAFGGRVAYHWSDKDGSLQARWERAAR